MGSTVHRARRTALVLLLGFVACAALVPQAARAQDPRAAATQRAARDWLALVDRLDAEASWKAAGERFRSAFAPAHWVDKLHREREARGAVVQRAVADTAFANSAVGLPDGGNYAIVAFRSSFANQTDAREEVMLEVGPDYAWHVIGYVIQ
jgi:hypothetical protein